MPIVIDFKAKISPALQELNKLHALVNDVSASANRLTRAADNAQDGIRGLRAELQGAAADAARVVASVQAIHRNARARHIVQAATPPAGSRAAHAAAIVQSVQVRQSYGSRPMRRAAADPFANDPYAGMNFFRSGAAAGDPHAARMFMRYRGRANGLQRGQSAAMFAPHHVTPQNFAAYQTTMSTRFSQGAGGGLQGNVLGADIMRMVALGQRGTLKSILGPAAARAVAGGAGAVGRAGAAAAGAAAARAAATAAASAMALAGGPLTIVAALVVAKLMLLAKASQAAYKSLGDMANRQASGGSASMGVAAAMERALGLGDGTLERVGRNLENGYGPIVAGMAGVNPSANPFTGDMNFAEKGVRVIANAVRNAPNYEEARRRAEMAGTPELAKIKLLSDKTYKELLAMANPNENTIRLRVETQARLAIAMEKLTRFAEMYIAPYLVALNTVLDWASAALDWVARLLKQFAEFAAKLLPGGGAARDRALKENTEAVRQNTGALKEGTYGGGPRAESAVPRYYNPRMPGANDIRMGLL